MYENVQEFLKLYNLHEKVYNKLLLNDPKLLVLFELKMLQDDKFKNNILSKAEITENINLLHVEDELLYDKIVNIMNLYLNN